MSKIILLLLVVLVVYWLFKGFGKQARRGETKASTRAAGEDMVRCAQCGVHLPRSESLMQGQVFFCSAEHRRAHDDSE